MGTHFIYGQKRVKLLLDSSITRNRLAHAYLFYGQPGVGKDAMAIGMAMGLNCTEGQFGGCNQCDSCKRLLRFEHQAFHMICPIPTRPKSMKEEKYLDMRKETILLRMNNPYNEPSVFPETTTLPIIGIDDITGLKREIKLKLVGYRYRIILISHADRLTIPASNSLLKLLEEPPEGTIFFLTTSAAGRLLSTIVSRCQKVRFDSLSEMDIANALSERWHFSKEEAVFFAGLSGGSLQNAIEFSDTGFKEKRNAAMAFLESCMDTDPQNRLLAVETLLNQWEKMETMFILHLLMSLLRDMIQLKMGFLQKTLNTDLMGFLKQFIQKWPEFNVEEGMRNIQQTMDWIQKNVHLPLALTELSRTLRTNS